MTTNLTPVCPCDFISVPRAIWELPNITAQERIILSLLFNLSHQRGYCWASNSKLAEYLGMTSSCLQVMLSRLRKKGMIQDVEAEKGVRAIKVKFAVVHTYTENLRDTPENVLHRPTENTGDPITGVMPPHNRCYAPPKRTLLVQGIPENATLTNAGGPKVAVRARNQHKVEQISRTCTPLPPKGGKKVRERAWQAKDETLGVAEHFWTDYPGSKPIGEKRIKKHLQELEALLASGVSEDQIFRAAQMLQGNTYCGSWVSSLATLVEKWPQIASKCNGHLRPLPVMACLEERPPGFKDLKTPAEEWADWDEYVAYKHALNEEPDETKKPTIPRPNK